MGQLRIIEPGMMSTVQDLGREGFASMGVPRAGAADARSLRAGNRLLGNHEGDAAIEMTLVGATVVFDRISVVCLTGASAPEACILSGDALSVTRRSVRNWHPVVVRAGEALRVGRIVDGARAYLCIAGGVRTKLVLGSRSVLDSCGLGGRALRAGDTVAIGSPRAGLLVSPPGVQLREALGVHTQCKVLRVIPGAHASWFDASALRRLGRDRFEVGSQSNRMGVRLQGIVLASPDQGTIRSEGVVPGSVQVPPGGEPIVLGVDGPTSGGYPVIACVIAADLPVLGQLRPGDRARFMWVDRERGVEILHESECLIGSVPRAGISPRTLGARALYLGCDTGEAPAGEARQRERAMLASLTAVSIACGGHAGDADSMREAVAGALAHGCMIGAHPSYPDREGFGRRHLEITTEDLMRSVRGQIGSLMGVCREAGATVGFVKAHGALYHDLWGDRSLAGAYARAVQSQCPGAVMVAPAGSVALEVWRGMGLAVLCECFVDRVYEPDATLRDRSLPGALVEDPREAARRAMAMVRGEGVIAHDGSVIPIEAGMLCVHADTPNAPAIVVAVRRALDAAGIARG